MIAKLRAIFTTAAMRCLQVAGWLIYLLDDPSIILKIGRCYCGHKEMEHSNDDARMCLLCDPPSRCPGGFLLFQKPNHASQRIQA